MGITKCPQTWHIGASCLAKGMFTLGLPKYVEYKMFFYVSSEYRFFFVKEVPKILYLSWPTNDGDKLNHISIPNHLLVKAKSFLPSPYSHVRSQILYPH